MITDNVDASVVQEARFITLFSMRALQQAPVEMTSFG
jgi:hypothetical protein